MKTFALLIFTVFSLAAQTDPAVLAQQLLTAVQALEAQLATANTQIATQVGIITGLQAKAELGVLIDSTCPTCRAVLTSTLAGKTNQVAIQLCCGPTTVPPTPPSLPNGYILIVISPEQPAAPAALAVPQR